MNNHHHCYLGRFHCRYSQMMLAHPAINTKEPHSLWMRQKLLICLSSKHSFAMPLHEIVVQGSLPGQISLRFTISCPKSCESRIRWKPKQFVSCTTEFCKHAFGTNSYCLQGKFNNGSFVVLLIQHLIESTVVKIWRLALALSINKCIGHIETYFILVKKSNYNAQFPILI
jgi:hypothetical protein